MKLRDRRIMSSLYALFVITIFYATMTNLKAAENVDDKIVKFAFMTDTHYADGSHSNLDLLACIEDINRRNEIQFVLLGGDITDFGSDAEILAVKTIFDKLNKPYYIVAGNHDAKWSESGCNTFKNVFGYEHFEFEKGGWRFIGCNCGPDMRMAPALIPKESMIWLNSLKPGKKTIFINHYPQDTSVLNYFDVTKALKKIGTRFEIGGHWHCNTKLNYDGIPGILGRASYMPNKPAGYNLITLDGDQVSVSEVRVMGESSVRLEPWYEKELVEVPDTVHYDSHGLPDSYPWMRYDVNDKYSQIDTKWKISDNSNIVAGFAKKGNKAYYTTASGEVKAISLKDGSLIWSRKFPGKIFSTPAVSGKHLVFGCADGYIYDINSTSGVDIWKYKAGKSVLGSPVIFKKKVYIGASDGCFRALNLRDGKAAWTFSNVGGFVECKPYVDASQVVFGDWANTLYSLAPTTGALQWKWVVKGCRMISPAACWPVKTRGKIYVAVPDRRVYVLEARTGKEIKHYNYAGRESIGLSEDGNTVYAKSMFHRLSAISAINNDIKWNIETNAGYEISPTPSIEKAGIVLMPTDKGNILAFSAADGSFLWAHKVSIALINPMYVWKEKGSIAVLASTMDGIIEKFNIPISNA